MDERTVAICVEKDLYRSEKKKEERIKIDNSIITNSQQCIRVFCEQQIRLFVLEHATCLPVCLG
jgi:hypothetical protein